MFICNISSLIYKDENNKYYQSFTLHIFTLSTTRKANISKISTQYQNRGERHVHCPILELLNVISTEIHRVTRDVH